MPNAPRNFSDFNMCSIVSWPSIPQSNPAKPRL